MPVKKVDGQWQEISWEEAIKEVAERVVAIQREHGNNTVGVYAGNPNVHNYGNLTHGRVFRKALQSKNHFSATSLDQLPHQLVSYLMYGHQLMLPVPDIDHTDFMLIIGGNPLASNGSLMTVPNVTKRLQAIQKRNGSFIVIDPRKTETAKAADEHLFIKPGTDVYLLLAMVNLVLSQNKQNLGHLAELVTGLEEVKNLVNWATPEIAESHTGIAAETIAMLTEKLLTTPRALVYGGIGTTLRNLVPMADPDPEYCYWPYGYRRWQNADITVCRLRCQRYARSRPLQQISKPCQQTTRIWRRAARRRYG
jgi:anaerobic selenocysteine-containing dehydrogenase